MDGAMYDNAKSQLTQSKDYEYIIYSLLYSSSLLKAHTSFHKLSTSQLKVSKSNKSKR